MEAMERALGAVLPRGEGTKIMRAFDLGAEADELCKVHGYEAWEWLWPTPPLLRLTKTVYRSHVLELIGRFKEGGDMTEPTKAELLSSLSALSLLRPPGRSEEVVYHRLFRDVMGSEVYAAMIGNDRIPQEEWRGQADELLADLVRRGRGEHRKARTDG